MLEFARVLLKTMEEKLNRRSVDYACIFGFDNQSKALFKTLWDMLGYPVVYVCHEFKFYLKSLLW